MSTITHAGTVSLSKSKTSEEKDVLKGSVVSADGSITNDDASLSVDLVKDEALKKEFIGKGEGDTVTFDIRTAFPNDYEIAGILRKQKDEVKDLNGLFTLTVREVSRFMPAENDQALWDKVYGEGTVTSAEEFEAKVTGEIRQYFSRETDYKLRTDARDTLLKKIPFELPEEFLKRWLLRVNEKTTRRGYRERLGSFP